MYLFYNYETLLEYLKIRGNTLSYDFNKKMKEPYLYSSDSVITEVNCEFIEYFVCPMNFYIIWVFFIFTKKKVYLKSYLIHRLLNANQQVLLGEIIII